MQEEIDKKKLALEEAKSEELNEYGIAKDSILTLTVVEASDLVTSDLSGMGDPYVVVQYLDKKFTTDVIKNNACPVWNKTFEIKLSKPEDLFISAYDYNGWRGDTHTGTAFLPLSFFEDQKSKDFWIRFFVGEKTTGRVHINAKWHWSRQALIQQELEQLEDKVEKT